MEQDTGTWVAGHWFSFYMDLLVFADQANLAALVICPPGLFEGSIRNRDCDRDAQGTGKASCIPSRFLASSVLWGHIP